VFAPALGRSRRLLSNQLPRVRAARGAQDRAAAAGAGQPTGDAQAQQAQTGATVTARCCSCGKLLPGLAGHVCLTCLANWMNPKACSPLVTADVDGQLSSRRDVTLKGRAILLPTGEWRACGLMKSYVDGFTNPIPVVVTIEAVRAQAEKPRATCSGATSFARRVLRWRRVRYWFGLGSPVWALVAAVVFLGLMVLAETMGWR
jgi:hypothetical protein